MQLHSILLLSIALFANALYGTHHHETAEEKHLRHKLSREADAKIPHLEHGHIKDWLNNKGLRIIFFGAHWCKYTQRFNPKFVETLEILKNQYSISPEQVAHFDIRKVECSTNEDFCTSQHQTDGYPTINVYVDGKFAEEYPGSDEVAPFVGYIVKELRKWENGRLEIDKNADVDQGKYKHHNIDEVDDETDVGVSYAETREQPQGQTAEQHVVKNEESHIFLYSGLGLLIFIGGVYGVKVLRSPKVKYGKLSN